MGYWFTIIGVIFQGTCSSLFSMGVTGESADFAKDLFFGLAVILSVIGVLKTLIKGDGLKGKLIGVGIHALIWIIGMYALSVIVPVIIIFVALFIVDRIFLGGAIWIYIHDKFAGLGSDGEIDWPIKLIDYKNDIWIISNNFGENASYTHESDGRTITVKLQDVKENSISTIYGDMTW